MGIEGIDIKLEDRSNVKYPKGISNEDQSGNHEEEKKEESSNTRPLSKSLMEREPNRFEKMCPMFSLRNLAPYFNIDTQKVRGRFLRSLIPLNSGFYREYR